MWEANYWYCTSIWICVVVFLLLGNCDALAKLLWIIVQSCGNCGALVVNYCAIFDHNFRLCKCPCNVPQSIICFICSHYQRSTFCNPLSTCVLVGCEIAFLCNINLKYFPLYMCIYLNMLHNALFWKFLAPELLCRGLTLSYWYASISRVSFFDPLTLFFWQQEHTQTCATLSFFYCIKVIFLQPVWIKLYAYFYSEDTRGGWSFHLLLRNSCQHCWLWILFHFSSPMLTNSWGERLHIITHLE